jgi:hypothetical protein
MRAVLWSTVAPTSLALGGTAASGAHLEQRGTTPQPESSARSAPLHLVPPGFSRPSRRTFYNIDEVVQVPGMRKGYNVSGGFGVTYERGG